MDKTGQNGLYSVKMRASRGGANISGAERIVPSDTVAKTAAALAERALSHPKGAPDFVNIKIEGAGSMLRLKALPVSTNVTHTAEKGIAKAAELLAGAGITRIDEIMSLFSETYAMRGAMLLDADTLERLEPDRARGVRATYMDDAESLARLSTSGKNHYAEAIVLATKAQNAPGIIGEICVSDDPDYVTGYVATREIGYQRITTIKEKGSPNGGRIFLYRGPREDVPKTIDFLEHTRVIVEDVPALPAPAEEHRLESVSAELSRLGIAAKSETAIVSIIVGDERKAMDISAKLLDKGFLIPAIRYPTVARGSARLRCAIMSAHTEDQLRAAADAIANACRSA